jgi:hypothetical protein
VSPFTFESLAKWLFAHSHHSYMHKTASLAAINNMSTLAVLSPKSIITIGLVHPICESIPCDRSLVKLAAKFQTSVRQLLEHNHRYQICSRSILAISFHTYFAGLLILHGSILMCKWKNLPSLHHQV